MYVFPGEITDGKPRSFAVLQQRLLERLRCRLRQGIATERGIARASGLSQPHVHNLLKGVRAPTVDSSDALLGALDPIAVAQLFGVEQARSPEPARAPSAGVRVLLGVAGPGAPWVDGFRDDRPLSLPCSAVAGLREPAALRVEGDADMRMEAGLVLVDCRFDAEAFPAPDCTYVVIVDSRGVVRWVRPGRDCFYLATDANLDRPALWTRVSRATRVIARVAGGERPISEGAL